MALINNYIFKHRFWLYLILLKQLKMTFKTIICILLFQLSATTLICCECEGESTVKSSFEGSDIVVSAVVISQTVTSDLNKFTTIEGDTTIAFYKFFKYPSRVVKLKITNLFKGQVSSDTITIITPPNGAGCGVYFETGKQYIIYGTIIDEVYFTDKFKRKSTNNTYWTHSCTRTMPWYQNEEDEIIKLTKK